MKALPNKWAWLAAEKAPKILIAALAFYGLKEILGKLHNQTIMGWAKELGITWYENDETAWCGLFMGKCAKDAGYPYKPFHLILGAKYWVNYGNPVAKGKEMLADIMVFSRVGGEHVGLYVAESADHFLVLGGNQSNEVGFSFKKKSELIGARRTPFEIGQPANIRKIHVNYDGTLLSKSEA